MKKTTIIVIFSILVITIAGCGGGGEKQKQAEVATKVITQQIRSGGQPEIFTYSGTVEADNTVTLSFSVPGRVTAVNVQEGQHVSTGQLLSTIETTEYFNAVQLAQAGLDQAADNFKRLNELHDKGSLPERDFISAKVSLTQAQANKSIAVKRLNDTRLYAPFAGIVSVKSIERGATAAPGVPAFTLLKTDQVYVQASVSESEISKLAVGKNATISIPVLNENIKGKISIINPQADAASKTFNVKIRISNPNGKLLPGMMSEIKIYTGKTADAIAIPASAVVRDADDITYVFVANEQNKAVRKRISASAVTGNNEILIKSGLHSGEKLIISGQTKLEDGGSIQF
jgi:RND family efflux transporter MFP subunit